jgi:hypothetical protein
VCSPVGWKKRLCTHLRKRRGVYLVGVSLLVGILIGWQPWDRAGENPDRNEFPAGGPAEFLYLDRARVIAYLAQLEGGTFTTETLTNKLSNDVSGKLAFQSIGEIGGSSSEENSLARDLTPTAAADYFAFLKGLGKRGGLETIGLGRFKKEVQTLREGQFVSFQTHALRAPVYVNPYLALRQPTTFASIYPAPQRARVGIERGRRQRARALHFRQRLGKNPRIVLALRPLDEKELTRLREGGKARPTSAPELAIDERREVLRHLPEPPRREEEAEEKVKKRKLEEEEHTLYLMPMDARLLTRERSLIKFGGGEFTVVGKVVRIFPEPGDSNAPAYVDSPTLETWEQPLAHAPSRLLCATDSICKTEEQKSGGKNKTAIGESRGRYLETLREQTEIPRRGAVILPIAIYK